MSIKCVFAAAALGATLSSSAEAQQSFSSSNSGFSISNALDSVSHVRLGTEIGDSAVRGDLGKAVGSLAAELAPRVLTKGTFAQEALGFIAGDGISFVTEALVNYTLNRPDNRTCLEKTMEEAGVEYGDIFVPGVSERGRVGRLEYEIALRQEISQTLTVAAKKAGRGYVLGCIENEQTYYEDELASVLDSQQSLPPNSRQPMQDDIAGSCVVTEQVLSDFFAGQYGGVGFASNNAVIAIANDPSTEIISREPYSYRISDAELCANFAKGEETPSGNKELSNAARWLVDQAINEGCEGRGGSMNTDSVFVRDLDDDGRGDLILSHAGIVCNGTPQRSVSCGAQVCLASFFLRRGDLLQPAGEANAIVESVDTGNPPIVTLYQHGGARAYVQWNGTQFVSR